nr:hypothetical protein [Tanacetum cinerariifolium]
MHEKFQMSAMGELNFFLGLQDLQKEDGIFLSQDKYVDPVTDEARPLYDSDVLSEVQDHDHYQDAVCTHHEEHYVKDNEVPVIHSNVSSVPNNAFMMIYNDIDATAEKTALLMKIGISHGQRHIYNIQRQMEHLNTTPAKIPILDKGKFKQWKFRIQQYLQHEYYALWEVIEFRDSYVVPKNGAATDSASDGTAIKKGRIVTVTTKDMQKRRNDVKARTTLLLALPDDHQLRFSKYKTAQELWVVILKTFGGNEATKKTKKNLLKQQYGNFKAEGSKTLDLAPEWLMHTIVWRNRSDLDTMSLDDLYNHLKVYEFEVQKKPKSNSQNMAFISSSKNSSGNEEVNTASIPTASTNVSPASANIRTASLSQVEGRLIEFKNQEIKFCEKIRGLEFSVECKTNRIENITNELETLKKAKEVLSPPPAQVYSPPKKDMSWTGLLEFANDTITDYTRPSPSVESNQNDLQNSSSSASENGESNGSILSKPEIKFVRPVDSLTVVKTDKKETVRKPTIKYAKLYRKTSKRSNGNSQNNIDSKGYWDSGCSRHMIGKISYLLDYEPFDGGYVSFGQGGCKITGKGTIKTGTNSTNFSDTCNADAPESSGNPNPTATTINPPADQMETLTVETPIPIVSSPVLTGLMIFLELQHLQLIHMKRTLMVRPIRTKWVLKNKKDERGIVIRNKARLVAQRHTQEEGIDYDEVFAPVARIESIKIFLAYASFMGFTVYQMDVKSAFLYGTIDVEVYVMHPPGFQDPKFPAKVYKVEKAIEYEALMYENFQMSAMGELNFFLGLQVLQKKDVIFLSQDKYGKDGIGKDVDLHLYRSMIGSFMYLTASRLDIMFAICAYARHQVTPKECHIHAVKRIFRYLKGHPKLRLWYAKESLFDLVAYSDSDYGGATQDRNSTTRGC